MTTAQIADMFRIARLRGMSPTLLHGLLVLSLKPGTMRELASAMGVTSAACTGVRDNLVALGYATDQPHDDRRSIRPQLTPAGQEFLTGIQREAMA